jgi:hypothetical protein
LDRDIQKIVVKGLVIEAAKNWLAPTLTMIAVSALRRNGTSTRPNSSMRWSRAARLRP